MTRFGNNMKWTVSNDLRNDIERFFTEGLGCKAEDGPVPELRLFTFSDDAHIGVYFVAPGEALGTEDAGKAPWLEFHVDDVDAATARLSRSGAMEFEYMDKTHHYFTAPGGQVFRLAAGK